MDFVSNVICSSSLSMSNLSSKVYRVSSVSPGCLTSDMISHSHIHTQRQADTQRQTDRQTDRHTHTITRTRSHTHTHTHTHTLTHSHSHSHSHTHICGCESDLWKNSLYCPQRQWVRRQVYSHAGPRKFDPRKLLHRKSCDGRVISFKNGEDDHGVNN